MPRNNNFRIEGPAALEYWIREQTKLVEFQIGKE